MGSGASAALASIDSAIESSSEAVENEFTLMFNKIKETVHSDLSFYNYAQILSIFAISFPKIVPQGPPALSSNRVTVNVPKDPNRQCITAAGIHFFDEGDEGLPVFGNVFETLAYDFFLTLGKLEVNDPLEFYDSAEAGINHAISTYGSSFPKYNISWSNWQSDQTLSDFVFSGLGQYYIKAANISRTDFAVPEEAVFEVDTSLLAKYTVRDAFEPYGVIAYFTKNRTPCGFYWCSQRRLVTKKTADSNNKDDDNVDDGEYHHVSALFRCSLGILNTISDHLVGSHWIVSNGLLLASERHLDASHPVRRLIKPHTFGAAKVNRISVASLALVGGAAYRMFGIDADSWPILISDMISLWKYETYEEHFSNSGLPPDVHDSLPLYQDGLDYWNITEKYVRNYVDVYYPSDLEVTNDAELQDYWADFKTQLPNRDYGLPSLLSKEALIKQLAHSIFWATANHTFSGDVQEYQVSPEASPHALPKEPKFGVMATKQSHTLVVSLVCMTSLPKPMLLNDWTHLLVPKQDNPKQSIATATAVQQSWQSELEALVVTIDERNRTRSKPFDKMNPRLMNSAVSV